MKRKIFLPLQLFIPFACILIFSFAHPIMGKATSTADTNKPHRPAFCVLGCIAWWSHDAAGYHPALLLMLDNISGKDLTGEEIPFQARFADLRDGDITVAREYKRTPVHNHERFVLLLRAPKSFELPIDSSLWPTMECKAMCRLPSQDSSTSQVEDLFMTHLSRITLSDEDAHAQLVTQAERSPLLAQRERISTVDTDPESPASGDKQVIKGKQEVKSKVPVKLPKRFAQVGNDFYTFEQIYGTASEFQASTGNNVDSLAWAHYHAHTPLFDVYAGSRNASKVDVLIMTLAAASAPKETDVLSLVRLLTGCPKEIPIPPFAHSVRYLSTGRSEIMTTAIRDRRVIVYRLQDSSDTDNNQPDKIAIFVTRLPGDPEASLSSYKKYVDFLHI